jgi:hypothetical protein
VVDPPELDRPLGRGQGAEQMLAEALVRSRSIRLSTKPFCIGLPGAM